MKLILALSILFFSLDTFSKEKNETDKLSNTLINLEIELKDGSLIKGNLDSNFQTVPFQTDHGKLSVSIIKMGELIIGIRDIKEKQKMIIDLIKKTSLDDSELADEIEKKFEFQVNEIYPILINLKQISMKDVDQNRLDSMISIFKGLDENSVENSMKDKLSLHDNSIIYGDLLVNEWKVQTRIGSLDIDTSKIHSIKFFADEGNLKKHVFTVEANKNIPIYPAPELFFNTKLSYKKGELIKIRASGSVILASLSSNTFSPEGDNLQGNWNNLPFGALVGKIGESGTPFKIGKDYQKISTENGVLYLTISETVYNQANSGSFKVIVIK
jgi:hypothetical protein